MRPYRPASPAKYASTCPQAKVALPAGVAPGCEYLALDVSIDSATHAGMASTRFTRDACASLPSLRPAVLVLKV